VRPRILGKVATVLQMASVLWILLKWDQSFGARWVFYITLAAAVCTGCRDCFMFTMGAATEFQPEEFGE